MVQRIYSNKSTFTYPLFYTVLQFTSTFFMYPFEQLQIIVMFWVSEMSEQLFFPDVTHKMSRKAWNEEVTSAEDSVLCLQQVRTCPCCSWYDFQIVNIFIFFFKCTSLSIQNSLTVEEILEFKIRFNPNHSDKTCFHAQSNRIFYLKIKNLVLI